MPNSIEHHLGEQINECDVCGAPIADLSKAFTREYLGKVYSFCSEECFKKYLENPELYAEFDEEAE